MNNELIMQYKKYLELERNYSDNTIKAYLNDLNSFNIYINKDLIKVNPNDIRDYLKHINNLSARTISHNLSSLKSFYNYLEKDRKNLQTNHKNSESLNYK